MGEEEAVEGAGAILWTSAKRKLSTRFEAATPAGFGGSWHRCHMVASRIAHAPAGVRVPIQSAHAPACVVCRILEAALEMAEKAQELHFSIGMAFLPDGAVQVQLHPLAAGVPAAHGSSHPHAAAAPAAASAAEVPAAAPPRQARRAPQPAR